MQLVNEITAECFNALNQLRASDGMTTSPEALQAGVRSFIDGVREKARARGVPERDVTDMQYALVALADEIAVSKPEPLRSTWLTRPLQMEYFNENTAGDGFFARLETIQGDTRRIDVLRVYYLCLLFGFQGRYAIRGGDLELLKILDHVGGLIDRSVEVPEELSPAGEPPDEPLVRSSQRNPFLWASLAVFAVAVAVFIGLKLSINNRVAAIRDRVSESSSAPAP